MNPAPSRQRPCLCRGAVGVSRLAWQLAAAFHGEGRAHGSLLSQVTLTLGWRGHLGKPHEVLAKGFVSRTRMNSQMGSLLMRAPVRATSMRGANPVWRQQLQKRRLLLPGCLELGEGWPGNFCRHPSVPLQHLAGCGTKGQAATLRAGQGLAPGEPACLGTGEFILRRSVLSCSQ